MEEVARLKYSGKEYDRGRMDAYLASNALAGFAKYTEIIANEVYGKDCRVNTHIQGFSRGSAEIQLLL